MEFPVHYSNVMLLDSDKNPTRVGFARETKGNRTEVVRIAKTNGKAI
jgi:large subunit ribosomal protein L24